MKKKYDKKMGSRIRKKAGGIKKGKGREERLKEGGGSKKQGREQGWRRTEE